MFRPTDDPSLSEEEQIACDVAKVKKTNDRRDLQRLIRMVLSSPLNDDDEILEVDGKRSIEAFKKKNTDMQTRIIINTAVDAAKGDAKAREFIFKYGGLEPVREQQITVDIPSFIDDISGSDEPSPDTEAPTEDDIVIYDDDALDP